MMESVPRIATAVTVGYVLGRTRRMKMAIMVGGILAGRKLGTDPKQLLQKAGDMVSSSPELSELGNTLQGRLLDAAKTAATSAASNKIEALGDNLTERAAKIRTPQSSEEESEERSEDEETTSEGEATEDESRQSAERSSQERTGPARTRERPRTPEKARAPERARTPEKDRSASVDQPGARRTAGRPSNSGSSAPRRTSREAAPRTKRGGDSG